MRVEALKEHDWLRQLVGEWTYSFEAYAEPGQPPTIHTGTQSIRPLGDIWILSEGRGEFADGATDLSQMTLGYDPAKQRFVGTYVGSMMTHLWVYEGTLDAASHTLSLDCEGPGMTPDAKMAKYIDAIELKSADHWVLTSSVLGEDGQWTTFMTGHHLRVK